MLWGSFGSGRREKGFLTCCYGSGGGRGTHCAPLIFHHHQQQSQWTHPEEMETYFWFLELSRKKFTHFSRATQKISPRDSSRKEKQHNIPNSRIFLVCEFVQLSGRFVRLAGEKAFVNKIFSWRMETGNKRCQKFKYAKESWEAGL